MGEKDFLELLSRNCFVEMKKCNRIYVIEKMK